MMKKLVWTAAIAAALVAHAVPMSAYAQDKSKKQSQEEPSVRAEMGEPLKAAQEALQAKKYKEALTKIAEAEVAGGDKITPYERYILDRMRGSAAVGAGDTNLALKTFNSVLESSLLPANERVPTLDALVRLSFSAKNFPATIDALEKYRAAGGTNTTTLEILPQALYLAHRYADATRELNKNMAATEAAGGKPTEHQIQLLASCALKLNDMKAYLAALQRMVTYYPTDKYWLDLIVRTANRNGFSDRLTLDVYRLRQQTNTLVSSSDYMEAVQLSLQAGFPGEADRLLKDGYKRGVLGKGDAGEVSRQKRLQELVARKIAEDKGTMAEGERLAAQQAGGDALISTGQNYVAYGQYDRGIDLMEKGLAKGSLKRPDESKLHLGYAYFLAGKKAEAVKMFATVKGADGSRDLAALWSILSHK
jgi:hypothetical protein